MFRPVAVTAGLRSTRTGEFFPASARVPAARETFFEVDLTDKKEDEGRSHSQSSGSSGGSGNSEANDFTTTEAGSRSVSTGTSESVTTTDETGVSHSVTHTVGKSRSESNQS